jgi:hypothetical protein
MDNPFKLDEPTDKKSKKPDWLIPSVGFLVAVVLLSVIGSVIRSVPFLGDITSLIGVCWLASNLIPVGARRQSIERVKALIEEMGIKNGEEE